MQEAEPATPAARRDPPDGAIAIVVLTHDRAHLVRQCVENVLLRTSAATQEIVIWDNGSTDGTADYLATLTDPRIRVVRTERNIGFNAYARAFRETTAPFMVELDDDVVDAPRGWDAMLRDAYVRLPRVGYLAADLEDDPHDEASRIRHHVRPHEYAPDEVNGVRLLRGPTGGGCAMTARWLNELAGGFKEIPGKVFWLEDAAYVADVERIGFEAAVLAGLRVRHTGGTYYSSIPREKAEFWERYWARRRRRTAVKRVLVRVPGVRALNDRFEWFQAPA